MTDLSQQLPLSIQVLGTLPSEMEQIQSALSSATIQWQVISQRDFSCLANNSSRFDCILIKVDGDEQGLDNIAALRHSNSWVPIIAFGTNWEVSTVVRAMKLGATEVCEFPDNIQELCGSVHRCVSPDTRRQARYSEIIPKALLAKLTSEEARILHLLVQGRTTKEVGATLDVSIRTVHYRKKELLRKLGVQNRSEAIELIRLSSGNLFPLNAGLTVL